MGDYYHLTLHMELRRPAGEEERFRSDMKAIETNHVMSSSYHCGASGLHYYRDMGDVQASLVTHIKSSRMPEERDAIIDRLRPYIKELWGVQLSEYGGMQMLWWADGALHEKYLTAPWVETDDETMCHEVSQ